MVPLVILGAVLLVGGCSATVALWLRRRRARRDLEGHFLGEWGERERWASLSEGDPSKAQ